MPAEVIIALKNEQEEGAVNVGSSEEEDVQKVVKRKRRRKIKGCGPHKKRACVDCTNRCARIHGRFSSSSSGKARPVPAPAVPSFFKVMMGHFSEKMEIPPAFAKTILNLAGSNIYLEDSFGLRWRVRVCLHDGVLSFGHGWKNFVLDHVVGCGEFLVFRQIARSVFNVQMFAHSAVERLHLCEKNQRQSRKRKPMQKTSSKAGVQTVKMIENSGGRCKKKRHSDRQHEQEPIDCKLSVQACIDDPYSASDLKYSETSEKAAEAGAAESREIEDNCTIFTEHPTSDATEAENVQGSSLPAHVDDSGPLAMMDLNEGSITDIYLSADTYEFESDICNPEAFPVDLNKEMLITSGQASGFNCLEHDLPNQHSSMEIGQGVVMSEVLPCIETERMVDALEQGNGAASVRAHDIDINVFPVNEPSSFGEDNSSLPTDAKVTSGECALRSGSRDKCACNGSQAEQIEDSSAMQDKPQDGQVNMHGSAEQHDAEIMSSSSSKPNELPLLKKEIDNNSRDLQSASTESGGAPALGAKSGKFCIAVPPPDQTWLELPIRLPVIPRTKKQGRKVVIVKDPCMRLWPVLYHCTPTFSGFITGWVDISRENSLREGDTCEFEFSGKHGLSFQLRNSNCCPAT